MLISYKEIKFIHDELTDMSVGVLPQKKEYTEALIAHLSEMLCLQAKSSPAFEIVWAQDSSNRIHYFVFLPIEINNLQRLRIQLAQENDCVSASWTITTGTLHPHNNVNSLSTARTLPFEILEDIFPVPRDAETVLFRVLLHDRSLLSEIFDNLIIKKKTTPQRMPTG